MQEPVGLQTQPMPVPTGTSRRLALDCILLEVIAGPDAGLRASLSLPSARIGTAADNDLVLTDNTVSRRHAELRTTPEGLVLRDLGSTNGTFCDGVRVVEAFVAPEMTCSLGATRLRITRTVEARDYKIGDEHRLGPLVGASAPMRELYGLLRAAAPSSATALIRGESGSGKELVARTLHELSGRRGPLVVLDASVTDPEMVRNDLFGHVKGAFTGAQGSREGAFRRAHGGTLFIDEIGELPPALQPRLLRVLESREVIPVGSDTPIPIDVRVVAATHRDLDAMVCEQSFRADLYFRLSVVTVSVPPLRKIKNDIPLLLRDLAERLQLTCRLSPAALDALMRHHWPGNVRELRNVLERAAVLCRGGEIGPEHLGLSAPAPSAATAEQPRPHLKDLERQTIEDALARHGDNKAAAARAIGISLSTLKRRLTEYRR